jgi:hypothetical protein
MGQRGRGLPLDEAREAVTGLRDAPPPLCGIGPAATAVPPLTASAWLR